MDAFPTEDRFQDAGGVRIQLLQQMLAALDHRYLDVESREKLGEFHGDRASTQHRDRLGQPPEGQRIVAAQIADPGELGQGRAGDNGAGADHKKLRRQRLAVAQRNSVGVGETSQGAEEVESAAVQLSRALLGTFLDQTVLPRHHGAPVEGHVAGFHPPEAAILGQVPHLRGIEQGLRRHAAAQDAEPANVLAAFNDDGSKTGAGPGSRCRVTGTAPADDGQVVVPLRLPAAHSSRSMDRFPRI